MPEAICAPEPELIVFVAQEDGTHIARLADIQIEFDGHGMTISKIASQRIYPCDVSQCPHGGDPDNDNCEPACIYAYDEDIFDWTYTYYGSDEDRSGLIAEFRGHVENDVDPFDHRKRWSKICKIFARGDWVVGGEVFGGRA